ncbi:MAG: hypothetical protein HGB36_10160 [Chlorobiaceae bacterium]|nr:hypothetical protein [Chlorobiaceae bacterium]
MQAAPQIANAISLTFDLLSMTGNELGVIGLPENLLVKISIISKGGKQKP